MSLINIAHLYHSFGDKVVFSDCSFRLLNGEHVGLIGANGSGKSTFLNILSGTLIQDQGAIHWGSGLSTGYLRQYNDQNTTASIRDVLKDAFKPLYRVETQILKIADQLRDGREDEIERLLKKMGHLQDLLDQSDFYRIDSLIEDAASGLGLKDIGLDTPIEKLSGGQKIKLMLARLLLERPDVLLLDEPTNYLDSEHINWLSGFLANYKGSFILVSHDIPFLNRVTNVIWHIEFARMTRYPGNYGKYLSLSAANREKYLNDYARQQKEIARMEDFIRKNIVRASTTGRAKSRQKALDKIERLEKPVSVKKPLFSFKYSRDPDRIVLETLELEVGYDKTLLPKLNLCLQRGTRVAVTGFNGIGKTTLLKSLLGLIPVRGGVMELGNFVCPVYYEQEEKPSEMTALDMIWNRFPRISRQEIRKILARCGLTHEHIMMPMKALSGGERSKARLCQAMLEPGNLLVLDEPTNHLDRDAKEALRQSLQSYKGSILLVCHENAFFEDWIDDVWDLAALADMETCSLSGRS